jgi:hypothetical protein
MVVACSELSTLMIAYRTALTDDNFLLFFPSIEVCALGAEGKGPGVGEWLKFKTITLVALGTAPHRIN